MAKRKIRDEADAHACLTAQAASWLTLSAWARREGIDGRSLNLWRVNLVRWSTPPSRPRLVELVPAESSARYVVRCGRLSVEVDDGFNEATLARLPSLPLHEPAAPALPAVVVRWLRLVSVQQALGAGILRAAPGARRGQPGADRSGNPGVGARWHRPVCGPAFGSWLRQGPHRGHTSYARFRRDVN